MEIEELSSKTGLSLSALQQYENEGLISLKMENNHQKEVREYPAETLQRIFSIQLMQEIGFSPAEISGLLKLMDCNDASSSSEAEMAATKLEILTQKINGLKEIKQKLKEGLRRIQNETSRNQAAIVTEEM